MRWEGADQEDNGSGQSNRQQRADAETKEPVEIMPTGSVKSHGGDE
jgi:hypothetical protein